jgi:photosystem II stability/assembly factor-like uncharacterized protein
MHRAELEETMPIRPFSGACLAGAALLAFTLPLAAQSPEAATAEGLAADDPAVMASEAMPRASRSLLLDAVRLNGKTVLVGERGHILSTDDGQAWAQASVPTRSTLTTITEAGGSLWAAGHDGVILRSTDEGKTWERQRVAPWQPGAFDAAEGVPVLDMAFTDADNGLAIGAYSLMLVTSDGGATWTLRNAMATLDGEDEALDEVAQDDAAEEADAWTFSDDDLMLEAESDPHFNALARTGSGALVIAGERGSFLRSRDNGRTWEMSPLPYEGSMFGVLAWEDEHVLAFGLRGNAFESFDLGTTWTELDTGLTDNLMGGVALPNGGALIVGANGAVLYRPDAGAPFRASAFETAGGETPVLSSAVALDDGSFLLVGDKGVDTYRPE